MAWLGTRIQTTTQLNGLYSFQLVLRKTGIMSMNQGKSKRPICPSCSKPTQTCLCSRILTPAIDNSVSVTILQHTLEIKHPLNSTRIARLGLKNLNVVTVSDVNFEARFVIWLKEPNSESEFIRNGKNSLIYHQAFENRDTPKLVDVNVDAIDSGREDTGTLEPEFTREGRDSSLIVSAARCSLRNDMLSDSFTLNEAVSGYKTDQIDEKYPIKNVDKNNEGTDITSIIGKHGVINSLSHIWKPKSQSGKPSFDKILAYPEACEALSKGFSVTKLQRKQLNGSIDLEECEEFELEVPHGSVLLFPSDKAVDISDLDAIGFKVKNLIVLDGTWAKARRIYSENPWLRILPHIKLEVNKMSLYSEVRHQPQAGYLSTIESIVYALRAVGETHDGLDNLLDAFESMVRDQRRSKDERLKKRSVS